MKAISALLAMFFALNLMAAEYKIEDGKCSNFGYYHKAPCLLIITNGATTAGVLIDSKYVYSKVSHVGQLLGSRVSVNLSSLLMLTLEEDESIRGFLDYPGAPYYSATSKDLTFLDF